MRCAKAQELAALAAGGDLDFAQEQALGAHLQSCPACAEAARSLARAHAAIRSLVHGRNTGGHNTGVLTGDDGSRLIRASASHHRQPRLPIMRLPRATKLASALALMLVAIFVIASSLASKATPPRRGEIRQATQAPAATPLHRIILATAGARVEPIGMLPAPRFVCTATTEPRISTEFAENAQAIALPHRTGARVRAPESTIRYSRSRWLVTGDCVSSPAPHFGARRERLPVLQVEHRHHSAWFFTEVY